MYFNSKTICVRFNSGPNRFVFDKGIHYSHTSTSQRCATCPSSLIFLLPLQGEYPFCLGTCHVGGEWGRLCFQHEQRQVYPTIVVLGPNAVLLYYVWWICTVMGYGKRVGNTDASLTLSITLGDLLWQSCRCSWTSRSPKKAYCRAGISWEAGCHRPVLTNKPVNVGHVL